MKKHIAFVLLTLFLLSFSFAQEKQHISEGKFPLIVSFIKHSTNYFFKGAITDPLHPGFLMGTEFTYAKGKLGKIYQTLNSGYFYDKYVAKGLMFFSEFGYRYTMKFGLFVDALIGGGYLRYWHPQEIFALNSAGSYERVKDKGRGAAMISTAMGFGYSFSEKLGWPIDFFLRYQLFIQTSYSKESSLRPHQLVHIGIRYKFNRVQK